MLDLFGIASFGKFFTYLTAFFGAFLAALSMSLIFWTLRDIRSRSHDKLVHILTAILVAVLNLPGLIIYLILRPSLTLTEEYQLTLEEEALLSQVEERLLCPGCGSHTESNWQVCAHCHTRLRKECRKCGQLLQLPWQICPHCTTPVPGTPPEDSPAVLPPITE